MILNSLPPEPKLKLDSESLTFISETEKLLSQIELLINFTSVGFYNLIKINEAINNYSLDYNTGWNLESYFFESDTETQTNKLIRSVEVAQKILKDVKPSRLIKTIHKELIEGKASDEFRTEEPTFSFSLPASGEVPGLMNALEQYLINDVSYHPLVNAALVHAQFEMIHPFNSHNGIVGRTLMQLHFVWKKKLSVPVLQISKILRGKKIEYFDRLDDLARNNNWNGWFKFMLRVFYEAASLTLQHLTKLHTAAELNKILLLEKNLITTASLKLIDLMKRKPVITIQQLTSELDYSKQTLSVIISKLLEVQVIEEVSGKQRYRVFKNKNILNAIE
ncbi:MAG: Fic family protein [Ignavibacteriales bacterium]|nr:Fic family protein [Ignavibacteriales bacterium]